MSHRHRATQIALLSLLLGGCASYHPGYQGAFAHKNALPTNHRAFAAPQAQVMTAAEMVLINQGFAITNVHDKSGIIMAKSAMLDPKDHAVSWLLSTTVLALPTSARNTEVSISATEEKVLHQKTHSWWHLLFIIPLFPDATYYHTVVRRSGVVRDKAFYVHFFHDLSQVLRSSTAKPATTSAQSQSTLTVTPKAVPTS